MIFTLPLQVEAVKQSHALLNAFKMPTQSMVKTMQEAEEQSSKHLTFIQYHCTTPNQLHFKLSYILLFQFSEWESGNIDHLTNLLAEDWAKLGTTREIVEKTAHFFQTELENTWGFKHLAIFEDEEAKNWVLGVGIFHKFDLEFTTQVCCLTSQPRV